MPNWACHVCRWGGGLKSPSASQSGEEQQLTPPGTPDGSPPLSFIEFSNSPLQPPRLSTMHHGFNTLRNSHNEEPSSPNPVCSIPSRLPLVLGLATVTFPPMGLILAMLSATHLATTTYAKHKKCEGLIGNDGQLMANLVSNEDPQPTSILSQHETNLTVGPSMEGIYDELKTSSPLTYIVLLAWNMLPLAALCFQSQLSPQLPLNNVDGRHCGHVGNCAELKQKQWKR